MSDESIALLRAWVESGAAEGEPVDDLQVPDSGTLEGAIEYQTPNFAPVIQGGELAVSDEYRCFLIDPELASDQFLTGYEVIPGNDALVHHLLVMPVNPMLDVGGGMTNLDVMDALDAKSPDRDGWGCFGAAGEGVDISGIPVTWAPGQGVVDYPEGTGVRIRQNDLLVVQIHFNLEDPRSAGQTDQSTFKLRLEDSVAREGFFDLPDGFLDTLGEPGGPELAPGQSAVTYTWDLKGSDYFITQAGSVDIYGVFPHMHELGRRMDATIIRGNGDTACAAEVANWDFDWQLYYFYETPIAFAAEDTLRVTCEYNTESVDEPVRPGWGTRNEMCLFGVFLVP